MISTQFPEFRKLLMDLDADGVKKSLQDQKKLAERLKREGYNSSVQGKTFVFSGFKKTPYDIEDYIYNNMGEISTSVTSTTTAVIAYTNTIVTPKIMEARGFGIPIYTQQEFMEKVMNLKAV
jgi:NAD-dependent DNA ligase